MKTYVVEVLEQVTDEQGKSNSQVVFSQRFDESFNLTSLVEALNKRRRTRKTK